MEVNSVSTGVANKRSCKKILIVERGSALAALLREVEWQEISCDFFCATTGKQALHIIPQLRPDLLIFDLHLADMTGIEVYEQIYSIRELALPPIILLNTHRFWERTELPLSTGIDLSSCVDYLLQTIEALLEEKIGTTWIL